MTVDGTKQTIKVWTHYEPGEEEALDLYGMLDGSAPMYGTAQACQRGIDHGVKWWGWDPRTWPVPVTITAEVHDPNGPTELYAEKEEG